MLIANVIGGLAIVIAVIAIPASVSVVGLAIMCLALWVSGVSTFLGAKWCAPIVILLSLLEVFPWFEPFQKMYERGDLSIADLLEHLLLCYAFPLAAVVWSSRRRLTGVLKKS